MAASSAARLPPPPADLSSRTLPIRRISGILDRIHRSVQSCLYFGKDGSGRFDDPLKQYGVLYAALRPEAAFAEVFLRKLSQMLILESDLNPRSLSQIRCKRLNCVDLTGAGLRQLSCDNRIATEKPYNTTGLWSRAIFTHPQHPGGIIYLSRHNPKFKCVAVFDTCQRLLITNLMEPLMADPRRPWTIDQVDKYQLAIQP